MLGRSREHTCMHHPFPPLFHFYSNRLVDLLVNCLSKQSLMIKQVRPKWLNVLDNLINGVKKPIFLFFFYSLFLVKNNQTFYLPNIYLSTFLKTGLFRLLFKVTNGPGVKYIIMLGCSCERTCTHYPFTLFSPLL